MTYYIGSDNGRMFDTDRLRRQSKLEIYCTVGFRLTLYAIGFNNFKCIGL